MKRKLLVLVYQILIMIMALVIWPSKYVNAKEMSLHSTGDYENVLQIIVYYETKDGSHVAVQGGTGFLIGNVTSNLEYIVTSSSAVNITAETRKQLIDYYQLKDDINIVPKIEVAVDKGVTIPASIVTFSDDMDFAILQLEMTLHDRVPFLLNDKDFNTYLRKGKPVTLIGYPNSAQIGDKIVYYTQKDLKKDVGYFEISKNFNGQNYLQHQLIPNLGNIGAPIVDENDVVIAMNQPVSDGKNYFALEISQITKVCDSLSIPYKTISQYEKEEFDKQQDIKKSKYKKFLIISVVITAILAIIFYLIATKKKRKTKKQEHITEMTVTEVAPDFANNNSIKRSDYKAILQAGNHKMKPSFTVNTYEENDDSDQTVVFSNNNNKYNVQPQFNQIQKVNNKIAYLIINSEKIKITKNAFTIGKGDTDYRVLKNPAISRRHATIIVNDNNYYIIDHNSTNGTYVNEKQIVGENPVLLRDNDQIVLANESFVIRIVEE